MIMTSESQPPGDPTGYTLQRHTGSGGYPRVAVVGTAQHGVGKQASWRTSPPQGAGWHKQGDDQ